MDEANLEQEETKKGGEEKKRIGIIIIVLVILLLVGFNIYLLTSRREVVVETETAEETRRSVVLDENNADEILDQMATMEYVEPGYYTVTMNYEWFFPTGDAPSTNAYVENLRENTNDVYFDLVLEEDESVVLYKSPVIPLGSHLENFALDTPLDAGTYNCVAIYHLVDEEQKTIDTLQVTVTVVVEA